MNPPAFALLFVMVLFSIVCFKSLLADLWSLIFIDECYGRRGAAISMFLACSAATTVAASIIFQPITSHIVANTFLIISLAPWMTVRLVTFYSWRFDAEGIRNAAFDIASERARRRGEPPPNLTGFWPWHRYIFDVEEARRRAIYEPPPI